MTLTEGFLSGNVFIDLAGDIMYGSSQVTLNYPLRFATVGFQLVSTELLAEIADGIRIEAGYAPMHPVDEFREEDCDPDGWYDFYIVVNEYSPGRVGSCIEFVVVNSDSPDSEDSYTIDLTEGEQEFMYARLDAQCRKYLGKTCEELLAESHRELEELERLEEEE